MNIKQEKAIMIVGCGTLQASIIRQCKEKNLFVVGIDISPNAECQNDVDVFKVIGGDDFEGTLRVAQQYNISGIITAATDKPLVMMARVADRMNLPFFSIKTAELSTDKLKMKKKFMQYCIPSAKGREIKSISELDNSSFGYPLIVKPRDNSGSRGVIRCDTREAAEQAIIEAFEYTKKESVLVEEYIEGQEYSVESLHYHGKSYIVQYTQKITTKFPYNVELGHIQPAALTDIQKEDIGRIISRIADAMGFENCASHTEIKINTNGIVVIETSPRLGGDYITSILTPLSTGLSLEDLLIKISIGEDISEVEFIPTINMSSGVMFFELREGEIESIGNLDRISEVEICKHFNLKKGIGDKVNKITNSVDRYGEVIFQTKSRDDTKKAFLFAKEEIERLVKIK